MLTELFQEGVTKCIVGTCGLLGEGWDASRINVLVDLTTVTTHMSINQLRGRSFRLDKHWPEKVANNWDVVCVLPESNLGIPISSASNASTRTSTAFVMTAPSKWAWGTSILA